MNTDQKTIEVGGIISDTTVTWGCVGVALFVGGLLLGQALVQYDLSQTAVCVRVQGEP